MNTTENFLNSNAVWSKSYTLDIELIDSQHSKFFSLFDRLLALNTLETYNQIEDVITELDRYTVIHFQTEEALMRKADSPDIELHLVQHELFKKKIVEFRIAYSYNNSILLEQIIVFMRKWLLIHISEIDGNYVDSVKRYMKEKLLLKNKIV